MSVADLSDAELLGLAVAARAVPAPPADERLQLKLQLLDVHWCDAHPQHDLQVEVLGLSSTLGCHSSCLTAKLHPLVHEREPCGIDMAFALRQRDGKIEQVQLLVEGRAVHVFCT